MERKVGDVWLRAGFIPPTVERANGGETPALRPAKDALLLPTLRLLRAIKRGSCCLGLVIISKLSFNNVVPFEVEKEENRIRRLWKRFRERPLRTFAVILFLIVFSVAISILKDDLKSAFRVFFPVRMTLNKATDIINSAEKCELKPELSRALEVFFQNNDTLADRTICGEVSEIHLPETAKFKNVNMKKVTINRSVFSGVTIEGGDWSGLRVFDSRFNEVRLAPRDLSETLFKCVDLSTAIIAPTNAKNLAIESSFLFEARIASGHYSGTLSILESEAQKLQFRDERGVNLVDGIKHPSWNNTDISGIDFDGLMSAVEQYDSDHARIYRDACYTTDLPYSAEKGPIGRVKGKIDVSGETRDYHLAECVEPRPVEKCNFPKTGLFEWLGIGP